MIIIELTAQKKLKLIYKASLIALSLYLLLEHGSWLNMIESWFGKLARTLLRGIRVESKSELERRILEFIEFVNEDPVVPRWKYKMDEIDV